MTRAVFLGSPAEAVPSLRRLADVAEVALVITNPDRPRGRSKTPRATPVKDTAVDMGLPVSQPATHFELLDALIGSRADIGVVVAYGRLIRPESLQVPRLGFVNVHFSLLPRWRGASPVVRSILAGDEETGVSLMVLDEGMDTGPVIAEERTAVLPDETAGELTDRLAVLGAELLATGLPRFVAGEVELRPQADEEATAAAKVSTDEAFVGPSHAPEAVLRAVRAFNPKPGAWTFVDGERYKLWEAAPTASTVAPGTIAEHGGAVLLGLRRGSVELTEIQPAGKGRMSAAAWMRGRRGEWAGWGQAAP